MPDYAAHEAVYFSQAITADDFAMKKNPKYVNKVVAPTLEPISSIGGFRTLPDYSFDTMPDDYVALVLIGGFGWNTPVAEKVMPIIKSAIEQEKVIGAICNAASFMVTVNVVKPGKSGADEIKAMMDNFRACPPKELGGSKVVLVKDYKTLTATDGEGKATPLDMPEPSNVLQFFTEDGTKISVRPSGTEPKIKFYMEIKGEMHCPKCYAGANADAMEKVEAIKKSLGI